LTTIAALVVFLSVIITAITIPNASLPRRLDALGLAQVWVPAGCFNMGSDPFRDLWAQGRTDEQPAHQVCLTHGYWIDQYDVTYAAFDAFVKAGGYRTNHYWSADGLKWKQSQHITGIDPNCTQSSSQRQQPRVCVNWYEAEAYANWRTQTANDGILYRLPTEAEWEYTSRGPLNRIWPWGNTFDQSRANTVEAGIQERTNVGVYPVGASWVGAQDMAGNVYQWVADWYDDRYYQYVTFYQQWLGSDPLGPVTGQYRVLRGGCWYNSQDFARSAFRWSAPPDYRSELVGFRLVGIVPASHSLGEQPTPVPPPTWTVIPMTGT
jgi:formylglycine-generating enzyme required for sulfatase activity